jgi:ABC-2 type transport system permease protein
VARAERAIEQPRAVARSTPIGIWLTLLRHHLRLLAPSGIIWIIGLVFTSALIVGVWMTTFGTEAERMALARSVEGNPAFEAMFGKAIALHTVEGFAMWRAGGPLFPAIVIWGMLAGTRLARGDEDRGHDELLLGGVLSRQALMFSALAALTIVISIFAAATTVAMLAVSEISVAGSLRYALAMSGGFTFFAALGVLLVQLVPSRSLAVRIGLGVIGLSLGLRIISVIEQMPGWMPWLTPFGWFAETGTPSVGSDAPFLLFAVGTIIFAGLAVTLGRRREIHGSLLLQDEETTAVRGPYDSLWQHELLQDRPAMIGFGIVGFMLATIFGLVADEFVTFVVDFPAFAEVLAQFGLTDPTSPAAYIGLIGIMLVVVVTLYAVGHAAAMRDDEASGRLAVLLILPLERYRWLSVNITSGLVGIVVISLATGLGAMLGTAITGTMLEPVDALRMSLNLMPVAVLFLGIGVLVFGVFPQITGPFGYTFLMVTFLLVLLDGFLDLPDQIVMLSPFEYLAAVPGEGMNLTANAIYIVVGIVAAIIGAAVFRRRDLRMD